MTCDAGPPDERKEEANMRTLLLAGACVIFMSGSALACRGTTEYPEAFKALESSTLTPEREIMLREQLSEGAAMHEDAHRQGDMEKMSEAIQMLDAIKRKIVE